MSSITQGRGGRGGGRESSQGRGGRGYTHSNWRPDRGRGSSSVSQQQQPATPAGGREAIPKLVYGWESILLLYNMNKTSNKQLTIIRKLFAPYNRYNSKQIKLLIKTKRSRSKFLLS